MSRRQAADDGRRPVQFKRFAAPQICPDGKQSSTRSAPSTWRRTRARTASGSPPTDGKAPPKQLTDPKARATATRAGRPTASTILFESNRSGDGAALGHRRRRRRGRSSSPTSAPGPATASGRRTASTIAFVSAVYPEFSEKPFAESDKLNKEKDDEIEKSPVKAKVFTQALLPPLGRVRRGQAAAPVRRCDVADGEAERAARRHPRRPRRLPDLDTFTSGDDFTFTPDGKHLVFTAVPEKDEAWSTNYDICRVSVTNTSPKWETPDEGQQGRRQRAAVLPGRQEARVAGPEEGRATRRTSGTSCVADCEAGRHARRASRAASTAKFDVLGRTSSSGTATTTRRSSSPPTRRAHADLHGRRRSAEARDVRAVDTRRAACGSLSVIAATATRCAFTAARMNAPAEVVRRDDRPATKATPTRTSARPTTKLLAELDLPQPESRSTCRSRAASKMQMWILKPPGLRRRRRSGRSRTSSTAGRRGRGRTAGASAGTRRLWAAQGYVVALPNPRGTTGFGQKFVDEITGDWGGKCYRDLMAGLDYVEKLPYVDKDRIGRGRGVVRRLHDELVRGQRHRQAVQVPHHALLASGTSRACGARPTNCGSTSGSTAACRGRSRGKLREVLAAQEGRPTSASTRRRCWSSTTISTSAARSARGTSCSRALQRQGVPSRFINFPDEGHWVLKPKNSEYWHKEVFAWLKKYVPPGGK